MSLVPCTLGGVREKRIYFAVVVVGPVGKWGRLRIHFPTGFFLFASFSFEHPSRLCKGVEVFWRQDVAVRKRREWIDVCAWSAASQ